VFNANHTTIYKDFICESAQDTALSYVEGYCLALDMTDRAGQQEAKDAGKPWTAAKGWDTSCPVSDFIPAQFIEDPASLTLWLKVNGELRQHASTGLMIFDVPHLLAAVSEVHTLHPGDLVLTGTPAGVNTVVPGDIITAGIEEIGFEIEVPVVER
jgi:acylpyruvate hydrolase